MEERKDTTTRGRGMNNRLSLPVGTAGIALMAMLLGTSHAAYAGYDGTRDWQGGCVKQGTIVSCSGTMAGIRAQLGDRERYVYFNKWFSPGFVWLNFTGRFVGTDYSCTAPSTPEWINQWDAALSANAYFRLEFDSTSGTCTLLQVLNGSSFKNASAL
jgi:hypothetical protein